MNCTFCGKVLDKTAPIVPAARFCLYRNGYWVEVTRAAAHVKCHEQHQQSKLTAAQKAFNEIDSPAPDDKPIG